MTANLPLTGGGAGGGGTAAAGSTGGGGAPAPRGSNNGSSNPLMRLSSAFRTRLAGAPPSPVVHGGSRPRFGSAMSGPGRPGGGGAAPGSPRGVVPPRTSDVAGAAASGQARSGPAGAAQDRRVLGHCLEEVLHEGEEPPQQRQQLQLRCQQQSSAKGPALGQVRSPPEPLSDLAAKVRAAIAASRGSRGEGQGGGACATVSIELQAPPAPETPAPSRQLGAGASSGSGPRRGDIMHWRGGAEKQGAAVAAAGALPRGSRGSPAAVASAGAAGSGAAARRNAGDSLDEQAARQTLAGPSSQSWGPVSVLDAAALPVLPAPSHGHQPPWPGVAAAAAAAPLAVASASAAGRLAEGRAFTSGEGSASAPASRSTASVSSSQLSLAEAAVKTPPTAGALPSQEVPALTSSNEIEVHTSPVGWASAQPQPQRSSTHSGPSTAGIWASSAGPGGQHPTAPSAFAKLAVPAAAASPGGGGPSLQPAVSTPAAVVKPPPPPAVGKAPALVGPGTGSVPVVAAAGVARGALLGTAAAVAAMPATETPEQLAAAAAAADAGDGGSVGAGSGEDLVPLRLLYRGLRMRAAVSCGPLKGGMVAGDVSGHVSYRGKAFAQLAKLMAKAKTGQVGRAGRGNWAAVIVSHSLSHLKLVALLRLSCQPTVLPRGRLSLSLRLWPRQTWRGRCRRPCLRN